MLFSLTEILDIIITTVAASFIFSDIISPFRRDSPLGERLLRTSYIVAPAIILHEFGHKFVALALGLDATFNAAYVWLAIGVVLKLVRFPLILLVPAYVAIVGTATQMDFAWVALAGPAVNLVIFLGSWIALKYGKWSKSTMELLYLSKTINLFLFGFNMLPIPMFDGYTFWTGIF